MGLGYGKPKGQVVWGDALYFKDAARFHESIGTASDQARFQKTLKAVLTLALYGYLDYALELTGRLRSIVQDQDVRGRIDRLDAALKKRHFSNLLPRFPVLRNLIAEFFHCLHKLFRTGFEEHTISGRDLGNL